MKTVFVVAVSLVLSASFAQGADRAKSNSGTEITVDAELVIPSKNPLPSEAIEHMKGQLKESGLPQSVVDETIERNRKSQPEQRLKRSLLLAADGVNVIGEVLTGEASGTIQATNGKLIATRLSTDEAAVWTVERAVGYSMPHVLASGLWPVYMGLIQMSQIEFAEPIAVNSWKFSGGSNKTTWVARSKSEGRQIYESRYGTADRPQTTATISADGAVVFESDLKGNVVQKLSLNKLKSGPADAARLQLARSLGKAGEQVVDCRFGEKECVSYLHPGTLPSDEEVQEMLRRKQPEEIRDNGEANVALISGSLIAVGIGVVGAGLYMVMKSRQR